MNASTVQMLRCVVHYFVVVRKSSITVISHCRIEEVERTLADQRALQEDTRVKMQCTINQQTKLIDFLQSKMDNKKKKVCKSSKKLSLSLSALFSLIYFSTYRPMSLFLFCMLSWLHYISLLENPLNLQ